jgi:hypothetical protein
MTIFRKILRVKTVGSRETGDLRPAIVDDTLKGVNTLVLEYSLDDSEAIVEIWGSNHPIVPAEARMNADKIAKVSGHPSVIEELATHPLSPAKIGQISGRVGSFKADKARKVAIREGKEYPYKRIEKRTFTDGLNYDVVIFDEG